MKHLHLINVLPVSSVYSITAQYRYQETDAAHHQGGQQQGHQALLLLASAGGGAPTLHILLSIHPFVT